VIKYGVSPNTHEPVKNLLLTSWAETEKYIKGIKGTEFKGFVTKAEAEAYLHESDPLTNKSENSYPQDALHCYVDGSFNSKLSNYSYGLVCVSKGQVLHYEGGIGNNQEAVSMQQIGGELLGAIKALVYAKNNKLKSVVIFHDYKGVCYHAIGYWQRDNKFSEYYYQWMQKFFHANPEMNVTFCKVDAHSGDDFNELADGFAKLALGITPNKIFYRMSLKYNLDIIE